MLPNNSSHHEELDRKDKVFVGFDCFALVLRFTGRLGISWHDNRISKQPLIYPYSEETRCRFLCAGFPQVYFNF